MFLRNAANGVHLALRAPGVVSRRLLRKVFHLGEDFKCGYCSCFGVYFVEALHACETHCVSQVCKVSMKYDDVFHKYARFSMKYIPKDT
jgi:hypothetical protein